MHEVIDYENLTLEDFYAKQEPILAKLIKNRPNGRQFRFWSISTETLEPILAKTNR